MNVWPSRKKETLSWTEASVILSHIKYKPNFSFGWAYLKDNKFLLQVSAQVINADDFMAEPITITLKVALKHESEEQILLDVLKTLIDFETHEAREFFRHRDHKAFDPHDKKGL